MISSLLLAVPAAAQSKSQDVADVSATYRSVVSVQELESWLRFIGIDKDPGQRALESLIVTRALAAEAEAANLAQAPRVRWALEQADLEIVWEAVKQSLNGRAQVTEAQARELADRYRTLPRRVRLRNLFKRYPAAATAADRTALREQMESLRRRVVAGESFAELAAAESQSQTRFSEGLIGNVKPGELKPAVEEVAFALLPGEVSAVLESENGLTLLFCERILDAVHRTQEDLVAQARQRLERAERNRLSRELREDLLAAADLVIDWPAATGDDSHVVAHWIEGQLRVEDLPRLIGVSAESLARKPAEEAVRSFVTQRMARLYARRHGLLSPEIFLSRRWARLKALAAEAMLRRVESQFQPPTEQELRTEFENHQAQIPLRRPHFVFDVLSIPIDAEAGEQSYLEAADVERLIRQGKLTFEEAAKKVSSDPSAAQGGRLPALTLVQVARRVGATARRAAKQLEVGELSGVLEDSGKLWILRLVSTEPERQKTFDEARAALEQQLGQARANTIQEKVTAEIWGELEVELGSELDPKPNSQ